MNPAFPLIRTKWSNERLMSALLLVLSLYNIPRFSTGIAEISKISILLVSAMILDVIANLIRFKRPVCAVSSAVTAFILYTFSYGVPFWMVLISLAFALLAGKHVWGGTGRNPINPAMVGLLVMTIFYPVNFPVFGTSWLIFAAALISLPFLFFRPYAGLGMIFGMSVALLLHNNLTFESFIAYGVVLWGSLIITDPVTTTSKPLVGSIAGLFAGFVPLMFSNLVFAFAIGILTTNIVSYIADRYSIGAERKFRLSLKHVRIPFLPEKSSFFDFTDKSVTKENEDNLLSSDFNSCGHIIENIEHNKVFGYGGAAFPTSKKIRTAMDAEAPEKHLIVNGVECDPGLIHDKWILQNKSYEINKGIGLLSDCIPFTTITVAVKDLKSIDIAYKLHKVSDYYPAGAEKKLIREVLGKNLDDSETPAMLGILVLNIQTVLSIYEAVYLNNKADTRFITYANLDERAGSVVRVNLGTDVHEISSKIRPGFINIYTGGGMMNACLSSDESVVDAKVNFIAVGNVKGYREALCSKCCFCNAVCPAHLNVNKIASLVDEGKMNQAALLNPGKCMNCGSCSYICLAGRNLANRTNKAKDYFSSQTK